MAWEWSHTDEAYGNARDNLHAQPPDWLQECWAEIQANEGRENSPSLNLQKFEAKMIEAKEMHSEQLADAIWEFAEQQRTCDNGGHEAWMCPFGCHTVSFDDEGNATE